MRLGVFFQSCKLQVSKLGMRANSAVQHDRVWSYLHHILLTLPITMGDRHISEDIKNIALKLWNQGWGIEEIYNTLEILHASLYWWEVIFAEHESVICPPSPLRGQNLRILTHALIQACQDLFSQECNLFLDEVVAWLALEHDIMISPLHFLATSPKLALLIRFCISLLLRGTKHDIGIFGNWSTTTSKEIDRNLSLSMRQARMSGPGHIAMGIP